MRGKLKEYLQSQRTGFIEFRETFLTLAGFKSCKYHDTDMKLYPRKKGVRDFYKTFFILKLWMFLEKYSPRNWGENLLLCKKPKQKLLGESRACFLDKEKIFSKTKFWANLIWLRRAGAPASLEGIAKLDTNWEQFARQIFNSFLWKLTSDNIWCMDFEEIINFVEVLTMPYFIWND